MADRKTTHDPSIIAAGIAECRRDDDAGLLRFLALFGHCAYSIFLAGPSPVFRAGVDLATFAATVTDKKGNIVTDLTQDDFEVIEDGKLQTIEYFAHGDGDAGPPMHLGLMVDASGSMQADMKLAQGAAIKFLNMLPAAEDITLVDFDTQVRITRYPQRDFARLVERIRQRKPDGWTALYDALGTYLDGADSQDGRKVLVMYTDGGDTRSALSLSETLTLLKASQRDGLRDRARREHRVGAADAADDAAADRGGDRRPGVLSRPR